MFEFVRANTRVLTDEVRNALVGSAAAFHGFCAQTTADAFQASETTAASAQITRAAQWVPESTFAAPRTEHNSKDKTHKESDKDNNKIQFTPYEAALRSIRAYNIDSWLSRSLKQPAPGTKANAVRPTLEI